MIYIKEHCEELYIRHSNISRMTRAIKAKALYKALLRAAQMMPAENQRGLALDRIRQDFR